MQPPAVTPESSGSEGARLRGDAGKPERDPLVAPPDSREADRTSGAADAEPPGYERAGKVRDAIDVTWDRLDVGDDVMDLYGDDIVDLDAY